MNGPAPIPQPRKRRPPRVVTVQDVRPLSPGMTRIVFGGDGLDGFRAGEFTDHYVKLHVPPPGAPYSPPFDPLEVREGLAREDWPRTRTFTVRAWDPERRLLTVDFVVHGDEGVAGPWAARAQPGDVMQLMGPGGAYAPDPGVTSHLFVGDESALPAIAASLERIPADASARVIAQVPGAAHELPLDSPAKLEVEWLHGSGEAPVLEAVEDLEHFAIESAQAFVHGEATMVRLVRRHLLAERGLPAEMLSASGYWKRDRTDEAWREEKPEWKRLAEADVVGSAGGS